jgi:type IV secretory pathway VirB3-like protein
MILSDVLLYVQTTSLMSYVPLLLPVLLIVVGFILIFMIFFPLQVVVPLLVSDDEKTLVVCINSLTKVSRTCSFPCLLFERFPFKFEWHIITI